MANKNWAKGANKLPGNESIDFEEIAKEPNCSSNFCIENRLSFSACLSRYFLMSLLFMVGPTFLVSAGVHLWVIPIRYRSRSRTVR